MMVTKPSLYDQNPEAWDRIAAMGCESLCDVAKSFNIFADLDRALGFQNASAKWISRGGRPSSDAERRAAKLLRDQAKVVDDAPRTEPSGVILIVSCHHSSADKARRLLAVLGCEVTEI